jgi:hypothetical protein
MSIENWSAPDEMLSCDACLLGMGAISKGKAVRNHDNNLFTNTLPGLTQDEMKCNFPSKDCNSFNDAFFFLNQD